MTFVGILLVLLGIVAVLVGDRGIGRGMVVIGIALILLDLIV